MTARRRYEASARTYGWDTVEPPSRQKTGAALFRLRIAVQEGLRPVFALYEHSGRDRCVGLSGRKPHPSRVSLEAGQIDRMATWDGERVGRGCRYKVTNPIARALALGLSACGSPLSLGRGALPVVCRHPDQPTVHLQQVPAL